MESKNTQQYFSDDDDQISEFRSNKSNKSNKQKHDETLNLTNDKQLNKKSNKNDNYTKIQDETESETGSENDSQLGEDNSQLGENDSQLGENDSQSSESEQEQKKSKKSNKKDEKSKKSDKKDEKSKKSNKKDEQSNCDDYDSEDNIQKKVKKTTKKKIYIIVVTIDGESTQYEYLSEFFLKQVLRRNLQKKFKKSKIQQSILDILDGDIFEYKNVSIKYLGTKQINVDVNIF